MPFEPSSADLVRVRDLLLQIARRRIGAALRARLDASDLVNKTLLCAHQGQDKFRGESEAEWQAWMRAILEHQLQNTFRFEFADKRNLRRETGLPDAAADESAADGGDGLPANTSTPSQKARREELVHLLAQALDELTEAQKTAVVLHHLQGATLNEVAVTMNRTTAAVAGLVHQGMTKLRKRFQEVSRAH